MTWVAFLFRIGYRAVPRLLRALLLVPGLLLSSPGHASTEWTVWTGSEEVGHREFVQELRLKAAGQRIKVQALADVGDSEDRANQGALTRSMPRSLPVPGSVVITVGLAAARAGLARPGVEPILLTLLSRSEYEQLSVQSDSQRHGRRIAALLRDPAVTDQLSLIDALLPGKRRLGVVVIGESSQALEALERSAQAWQLNVAMVPDARAMAEALRALLQQIDAVLVVPDLLDETQAATLTVLRAAAMASVPAFGQSEGSVRSGALAAAITTPARLALQAHAIATRLASAPAQATASPWVVHAETAGVRLNPTVARSLRIALQSEHELLERVSSGR